MKYRVSGVVIATIRAKNDADAMDEFCSILDPDADITTQSIECTRIEADAPVGAERWAKAATELEFGDNDSRERIAVEGPRPGTYWWSDGIAALLCEGPLPDGYRVIPAEKMSYVPTVQIEFGPADESRWPSHPIASHPEIYAMGKKRYGIAADLRKLVEQSAPGVTWWSTGRAEDPYLALDGDTVVAVVMGVRSDLPKAEVQP